MALSVSFFHDFKTFFRCTLRDRSYRASDELRSDIRKIQEFSHIIHSIDPSDNSAESLVLRRVETTLVHPILGILLDLLSTQSFLTAPKIPSILTDFFTDLAAEEPILEKPLGKGFFGTVELVRINSSLYARKVIKVESYIGCFTKNKKAPTLDEKSIAEAYAKKRMLAEVRALISVSGHENIVQILGYDPEHLTIYMNYVQDETAFTRFLVKRCVSLHAIQQLAYGVLNGLSEFHRHHLVHADITPANILMRGDEPVICDAGGTVQEDAFLIITTEGYKPPEYLHASHARKKTVAKPSYDMWSIGIVIYQLIQGSLPFSSNATLKDKYDSPGHLCLPSAPTVSDVGSAMNPLIERCLTYKAKDRPTAASCLLHPVFASTAHLRFLSEKSSVNDSLISELEGLKI